MFLIKAPIIDLSTRTDLLFFTTDAESLSIITDVNPFCFPSKIAWRQACASATNEEATALCTTVLEARISLEAFLATTLETDLAYA
ncbi:hypothetical protein ES288_A05G386100v1 [Gossypium darwinii]|uniref:Uncharacterized protein n=1 Tax=Gossypium darwinii TaxID=34276 RepID=A0A5D2GPE0_GOSDA|nr:hypothetical protein ES288_A05G386100v1 [Gossypium darwinii]